MVILLLHLRGLLEFFYVKRKIMKISVDDVELFTLTESQKRVIQDNVPSEIFDADMKRRLQWILMHKYEECFKEFKHKWDVALRDNGVSMIPTDPEEYADLVFAQPNYKNRSAREALLQQELDELTTKI